MKSRGRWASLGLSWLFLLAAWPAHAQVAVLGRGWLLDSAGSITSTQAEVIAGRNSIKGSYFGSDSFTPFLDTDPTFIQFAPNQTYTITANYRIIVAGSSGFSLGFFSSTESSARNFVPSATITGGSGVSGTVNVTSTLLNYADYEVQFEIVGSGAIAIDDIRITDSAGRLVASENGEGPAIVPGPLNFQLTDAIALLTEARAEVIAAAAKDLDGDGHPETILTISAPRPCNIPLHPIVIESRAQMRLAASDFFPSGVPTVKCSTMILFADINNDGLQDILFSDAGSDPIGPGSRIGIALNLGGGKYRDVSDLIQIFRSCSAPQAGSPQAFSSHCQTDHWGTSCQELQPRR